MTTTPPAMMLPGDGPIALHEVELSAPLPVLTGDGPAQVLVRLHGRPLGVVAATLSPAGLRPDQLAGRVMDRLGPDVAAHLTADGLAVPETVPIDGVVTSDVCRPVLPAELAGTVVVTSCVASPSLAATLAGILAQSVPAQEIIVVDNRPRTSGIREQLSRMAGEVRYVAEPERGLSRARNAGLAAATTPVVVFTDDDVEVDPRWLEFLLSGFAAGSGVVDETVGCVTGLIRPLELSTPAQVWFEQFGGFGKGFVGRRFDRTENRSGDLLYPYTAGVFGSGANSAFRTDTLRQLGGFDEFLGTGTAARGGEDLDIFLSVVRSGHVLVYEPAALIRHLHKRTTVELRRQMYDYGAGLGAMVTKRIATQPAERLQIARLVPGGLHHLLHPRSSKNAGKSRDYPRSLTLIELVGVARGPVGYAASRALARRRQRDLPHDHAPTPGAPPAPFPRAPIPEPRISTVTTGAQP
ncbi:hypothetical protein ThrDRAFT_01967 [Frankia casuarinae]|uniref:Glycosyl transferase, family 2 n=1 Tax=Frankia casuarinae (strain DSM 45818 / CECT 9043 / HFP020203 / CcI3) TaxID=106370 RepID=Q2JCN5_FRACC|nr:MULTISPECIES: glycosyltransferase [Frankia]ABD10957.1 glycosyl transferase, family 2 [Frankia casuarinae]ETA02191.1 hypothetical protein CcI6DRAFT_02366 [Frankia sp. CcI6]EYT92357.1 hypothetical protein ThrDRAFT_01967 [Frankia casuarinae]KDA42874.1 hypothetical protein BMG523Draft_02263 [Frankia sp. BMG5.23]KEZ37525.1 Glycosyl transferase family 2 [Frankia sp. CeD]